MQDTPYKVRFAKKYLVRNGFGVVERDGFTEIVRHGEETTFRANDTEVIDIALKHVKMKRSPK